VVRALAKVSLVWALAVLGALFMATSAQGLHHDATDRASAVSVSSGQGPRTAGLALALVVLTSGLTVLALGATRGERRTAAVRVPQPAPDLSLALGLGLLS